MTNILLASIVGVKLLNCYLNLIFLVILILKIGNIILLLEIEPVGGFGRGGGGPSFLVQVQSWLFKIGLWVRL